MDIRRVSFDLDLIVRTGIGKNYFLNTCELSPVFYCRSQRQRNRIIHVRPSCENSIIIEGSQFQGADSLYPTTNPISIRIVAQFFRPAEKRGITKSPATMSVVLNSSISEIP